jgi:hypothetical protein
LRFYLQAGPFPDQEDNPMTRQTRIGRIRSALGRIGALALVVGLTACGGGTSNPTPPVTTPPPPVRSVIGNFTFSLQPLAMTQPVEVTVSGSGTGTVDATVQWTFSANDVDLYLTDRNCNATSIFNIGNCNILARADSFTSKPEVINRQLGAGVYRLYVYNDGPGGEAGTLIVGFTP